MIEFKLSSKPSSALTAAPVLAGISEGGGGTAFWPLVSAMVFTVPPFHELPRDLEKMRDPEEGGSEAPESARFLGAAPDSAFCGSGGEGCGVERGVDLGVEREVEDLG